MSREIKLGGNVEVDGHAVRKIHVSSLNPNYRKAIKCAQQRRKLSTTAQRRVLKKKPSSKSHVLHEGPRPGVHLLHFRWAGVCTRGGLLVVRPMPAKADLT